MAQAKRKIKVTRIPLDQIEEGLHMRGEEIDTELKSSIALVGQLDPILVYQVGQRRFRIIDGHRRTASIRSLNEDGAGDGKINALITDEDEKEANLHSVVNITSRRRGVQKDVAEAIRNLVLARDYTVQQIVDITKVGAYTARKYMILAENASDRVRLAFERGFITLERALKLAKMPWAVQDKELEKELTGGSEGDEKDWERVNAPQVWGVRKIKKAIKYVEEKMAEYADDEALADYYERCKLSRTFLQLFLGVRNDMDFMTDPTAEV